MASINREPGYEEDAFPIYPEHDFTEVQAAAAGTVTGKLVENPAYAGINGLADEVYADWLAANAAGVQSIIDQAADAHPYEQ